MLDLDKHEIKIPCERCGRKIKKSIGWIMTHSKYVRVCGTNIKIDTSQSRSEIAKVERSLADLHRALKNLGK